MSACDCALTYEVILRVVPAPGLLTDLPIRQVFKRARRLRAGAESPGRHLFSRVVRPLGRPETPGTFPHGSRLMGIDGVVLDVPDSAASAAAFGRPSAGPRGDGAFPRVRELGLVELGTHVEVAFAVKPRHSDERAMVAGLLRRLEPGMLLPLGRAFFSYGRWRQSGARGVKLLARVVRPMILRPVRVPADGSYLAKVYRSPSDRQKGRDGILVRVTRYTLDDPQRVGHGAEHVLITGLLDEAAHPAIEWIILDHERWEEESAFDERKAHQGPRRATKPAQLRSETPAGVIQEVYSLPLGHFVIRSLMFGAAATAGLDPDAQSFTGCFQTPKCRLPECEGKAPAPFEAWNRGVLWEMQAERTDPRRDRINPRVVTREVSKWKKKRPGHRHLLPLKKTFPEAVVMRR